MVVFYLYFYVVMVCWSEVLGGVLIFVYENDCEWVVCCLCWVEFWCGDMLDLGCGVMLLCCFGYFFGSMVLYW